MKAIQPIIGKLIVGCGLALSLVTNVHADNYYSAKDPDLPPLPSNSHPELPVVEVEKGHFVVDDTSIPDTPEEAAARAMRVAFAQRASTTTLRTLQTSFASSGQDVYDAEYAPWIITDIQMPDGSPLTWEALEAQSQTNLLSLSASISETYAQQQGAVSEFVQTNLMGLPAWWMDTNGDVFFIDSIDASGAPAVKATVNTESANTVSADKLWPGGSSGFSLTGTNIKIGQWDGGDVRTNHQEFSTNGFRVFIMDGVSPFGVTDHATHVAGTIAAWGVSNAAKGFSNRGTVLESDYINDQGEMPAIAATNALRVSNHSYVIVGGWWLWSPDGINYYWVWNGEVTISTNQDWHFGFYDAYARTNDQIIYTAQTYLPVFSAGNERGTYERGPATQPVYHYEYVNGSATWTNTVRPLDDAARGGYYTMTSYAMSKNDIVVGAVSNIVGGYSNSAGVNIAFFSSLGPAADGRIKPDITAAGSATYSSIATSNNAYDTYPGTSMSAPAVTGTLGLLTELHQRLNGTNQPMLASTLKGIVIHTADEADGTGPDYKFGWGLLNALSAAKLITNNYTSQSLANIKEVRLVSGDYVGFPVVLTNNKAFKATIVWTDPPGTPTAPALNPTNHMLVNDLDLRVVSPGGVTNFPWKLNASSPTNAATTGDNTVDNVEQISIPAPTNGTYLVRVTHKGNLVNDAGQTSFQNVSIMLSGNIAQPPTVPKVLSILALPALSSVALKWSSDVGRVYRVQYRDDISAGIWQYATGELSATKTNTAATINVSGAAKRFYRIAQVR